MLALSIEVARNTRGVLATFAVVGGLFWCSRINSPTPSGQYGLSPPPFFSLASLAQPGATQTPAPENYPQSTTAEQPEVVPLASAGVSVTENLAESDLRLTFLLDASANLIGALVGAILAIPTGLWIDRRRKAKEQQEQANVVLVALRRELDENRSRLDKFLSSIDSSDDVQVSIPSLSNDAWQAAHEMGILVGLNDYALYKQLLEVYEHVDVIEHLSETLWQIFFTPAPDFSFIETRTKLLNRTLQTECKLLLPSIERVTATIDQKT